MNRVYTNAKAGMQETDKAKILAVIEQSTTSDYRAHMENKNEEYQRRLNTLKDEVNRMSQKDWADATSGAEEYLFHIGNFRQLDQFCVHIDMDAYFANVEARDDPRLRKVPFAVGSEQMISTSNYIARKFGVRSAMPGYMAKKLCPQLVLVPGNYQKYGQVAKVFRKIFAEYDPNFHSGGLDEAYLNLTEFMKGRTEPATIVGRRFGGSCLCYLPEWTPESASQFPNATEEIRGCVKCKNKQIVYTYKATFGITIEDVVNEIRFRVEQETNGLTCSAGIAANSMLAKICSDINKPNNQFLLENDEAVITNFVGHLNVRKIPGIGPSTEYILNGLGWTTCNDILNNKALVWHLFTSKHRRFLLRASYGISYSELNDDEPSGPSRPSLSAERTFSDTRNHDELRERLKVLTESVFQSMKDDGYAGCKNIGIKLKSSKFKEHSKRQTLMSAIDNYKTAYETAKSLLNSLLQKETNPIRLIGIVLSDFVSQQTDMSKSLDAFVVSGAQANAQRPSTSADVDDGEIIFEKSVAAKNPKIAEPEQPKNSKKKKAQVKNSKKKKIPAKDNQGTVSSWIKGGGVKKASKMPKPIDDVITLDSDDENTPAPKVPRKS